MSDKNKKRSVQVFAPLSCGVSAFLFESYLHYGIYGLGAVTSEIGTTRCCITIYDRKNVDVEGLQLNTNLMSVTATMVCYSSSCSTHIIDTFPSLLITITSNITPSSSSYLVFVSYNIVPKKIYSI